MRGSSKQDASAGRSAETLRHLFGVGLVLTLTQTEGQANIDQLCVADAGEAQG